MWSVHATHLWVESLRLSFVCLSMYGFSHRKFYCISCTWIVGEPFVRHFISSQFLLCRRPIYRVTARHGDFCTPAGHTSHTPASMYNETVQSIGLSAYYTAVVCRCLAFVWFSCWSGQSASGRTVCPNSTQTSHSEWLCRWVRTQGNVYHIIHASSGERGTTGKQKTKIKLWIGNTHTHTHEILRDYMSAEQVESTPIAILCNGKENCDFVRRWNNCADWDITECDNVQRHKCIIFVTNGSLSVLSWRSSNCSNDWINCFCFQPRDWFIFLCRAFFFYLCVWRRFEFLFAFRNFFVVADLNGVWRCYYSFAH